MGRNDKSHRNNASQVRDTVGMLLSGQGPESQLISGGDHMSGSSRPHNSAGNLFINPLREMLGLPGRESAALPTFEYASHFKRVGRHSSALQEC